MVQTVIFRFSLSKSVVAALLIEKTGKSQFEHVPNFKGPNLRAQEELENVLGIYIDRKKQFFRLVQVSEGSEHGNPANSTVRHFFSKISKNTIIEVLLT